MDRGGRDDWGVREDDDWFAEPAEPAGEPPPRRPPQQRPSPSPSPPPTPAEIGRRRLAVLGGLAALVVLVVGGILLARAVDGSDEAGAPSTETIPTAVTPPPAPTPPPATSTTPPPSPPAAPVELPEGVTLRAGSEGDDVRAVQQALSQLGYAVGEVDGIYGPRTQAAVAAFQEASGLTADGIVGAETLQALSEALAAG